MAKIKVVQCYDDGVVNDIRLMDILRKYNAKATFNLNPGLINETETTSNRWANMGEDIGFRGFVSGKISLKDIPKIYDGFEVASHCWKHENALTTDGKEWIKSAVDAKNKLEDLMQKPCKGFAYPYGTYTKETCDLLRENGFAYGRTTEETKFVTQCDDVMALPTNCHFLAKNFYKRYEEAKECGVFYFWGHTYELMEYDSLWQQFENKIKYISQDSDSEWANVVDIAPLCGKK